MGVAHSFEGRLPCLQPNSEIYPAMCLGLCPFLRGSCSTSVKVGPVSQLRPVQSGSYDGLAADSFDLNH